MNALILSKKENTISPKTEQYILRKKIKENKFLILINDEIFDYIDNICETLSMIEKLAEGHKKFIIIFGDISERHQFLIRKIYSSFEITFIQTV